MDEGKRASLVELHRERQRVSYGREKEIQKTEGKRREGRTTSRGWDLDKVLGKCFVLFPLVGARVEGRGKRQR